MGNFVLPAQAHLVGERSALPARARSLIMCDYGEPPSLEALNCNTRKGGRILGNDDSRKTTTCSCFSSIFWFPVSGDHFQRDRLTLGEKLDNLFIGKSVLIGVQPFGVYEFA